MGTFDDNERPKEERTGIDLLSFRISRGSWLRWFGRSHGHWKLFSGRCRLDSHSGMVYRSDPNVKSGENISIIGSVHWDEFIFDVQFRLLTDSSKPPEGGVILYYLFRNAKNYYSIHFCVDKNKIEGIKRVRGKWTTMFEYDCDITPNRDYSVQIRANRGKHKLFLNGEFLSSEKDLDVLKGCVGVGVKYCDAVFGYISISLPRHILEMNRSFNSACLEKDKIAIG